MSDLVVRASDAEREQAVARLREACAEGRLTLEEFTARVDEAYGARTHDELERVTRELPGSPPLSRRRPARLTAAIFGHAVRRGRWRLGRWTSALVAFGDLDLDLRQAALDRGRATVFVFPVFGNADVFVPEGVEVDVSGVPIFGHCRDWGRDEARPDSAHVRVRVLTLFGTVDVWRVPPGIEGSLGEVIRRVRQAARS